MYQCMYVCECVYVCHWILLTRVDSRYDLEKASEVVLISLIC